MSNCFMPVSSKMRATGSGALSGLSFAAKANIDIADAVTTNGSPDWAASHPVATETAPVVISLLAAGAELAGTTICDELCFSINGENAHYGTPINPKAPGHIPGGSSSGSASAVASGEVDFALGTDTSGSVRLPASYCGVLGLRGTHGLISTDGVIPLAPSFDALGWFARSPDVLAQVGSVLWPDAPSQDLGLPSQLLVPSEALELCDPGVRSAFEAVLPTIAEALGVGTVGRISLGNLEEWREHLRAVQAREIWAEHRGWILANAAGFGPGMEHRLRWGERVSDAARDAGLEARAQITPYLDSILQAGAILILPSAPGPAPLLQVPVENQGAFRDRAIALTCVASLAGLPELSMPLLSVQGCPVGVSIIAARNADAKLASFAQAICSRQRS